MIGRLVVSLEMSAGSVLVSPDVDIVSFVNSCFESELSSDSVGVGWIRGISAIGAGSANGDLGAGRGAVGSCTVEASRFST